MFNLLFYLLIFSNSYPQNNSYTFVYSDSFISKSQKYQLLNVFSDDGNKISYFKALDLCIFKNALLPSVSIFEKINELYQTSKKNNKESSIGNLINNRDYWASDFKDFQINAYLYSFESQEATLNDNLRYSLDSILCVRPIK